MNKQELLSWLADNPNSTMRQIADAFPRSSSVNVSATVHGLVRSGELSVLRTTNEDGKPRAQYSVVAA